MKKAIYQNIKGKKILHLNQRVVKFYFFHVRLTKRVPLPITKSGALYVCEGYVNITRVLNV